MADYTPTAADVDPLSATIDGGIAGAAITAGQLVYKDTAANNVLKLAQCDGTETEAKCVGIAVNSAAIGQPVSYAKSGIVELDDAIFATPGIGALMVLSDTAGKMKDVGDLSNGERVTHIGYVETTKTIRLDINATGLVYTPGA